MDYISLCYIIFKIIFTFVIIYIVFWMRRRYIKQQLFRKYGIPGPKPNYFWGNMKALASADTPNDVMTSWFKEYGNIVGYYIGEIPHLLINDTDMIKQIFIKESRIFLNRPKFVLDVWPLCDTVLCERDQNWKKVRSILNPSFSASKIKQMTDIINRKVDKFLELIKLTSSQDHSFDIYDRVQGLSLSVIGECALAMKSNCQEDLKDSLLTAVRGIFKHAQNTVVTAVIVFPPLKSFLEFIYKYSIPGKMVSMIVDNIQKVIAYRRQHETKKTVDILQLMLDSSDNSVEIHSNNEKALTDNDIIANAYAFLLGGYETTANALAFTFYLLAKHQDIQERLYQELSNHLNDKKHPSYDEINYIQYLDQVFNESLRNYPPLTGFITRECSEESIINNITIAKGVVVQAPIWNIHHDPNLWSDPWTFDPDRFSFENKNQIHPMSFFPFGLGPRNCIGMRFAQIEAKLAIARLILNFKLITCDRTDDPLRLVCPSVIINPKNGVHIKAICRVNT